jgi:hypothetical protein
LASAPLITQLSFPSVIDVTDGGALQSISVTLADGSLGPGGHVAIWFDHLYFEFDIGANGASLDTLTDATPNHASSTYQFIGGYPVGDYPILSLYLWDDSGYKAIYSGADLRAMGMQTSFSVVDRHAPAAPTLNVHVDEHGLVDGDHAVLYGTAGAGEQVSVIYYVSAGYPLLIGTATADAQGNWSFLSDEWPDGHYTGMVATVSSGDHVSPFSAPLDFYVQQAPVATSIQLSRGTNDVVNAAKPLIWGTTNSNATVTVYDGGKEIATVQADQEGWWGVVPGTLAGGAHQLTAQVQDQFGRDSPMSETIDVSVAPPNAGINFTVGSLNNVTGQAFDVDKLQAALDAVSALVSGMLDGTQGISLKVGIGELDLNGAIAAARSTFHSAVSDKAMPTVTDAELQLSLEFAKTITDEQFLTSYVIDVLAHEMLHVLGISSQPSSAFQTQVKLVGEDAYYHGFEALAINGGPVPLSPDAAHVAVDHDLMSSDLDEYWPYFLLGTAESPYSALDLSILTALGYHNTDAIVSDDGRRHLPGNGKPGHDTVVGHDGKDTLYLEGRAAGRAIKATDAGFSVQDKLGDGGTLQLSSIERLYFADKPVALDVGVGQTAGMAYRMYQAAFNRAPDSQGLGFWIDNMDRGLSLKAVAGMFKSSPEFTRLYGADLSDGDFVTQLYSNVLHRKPDADGQKFWLDNMHQGLTQADVLMYFSESPENVAQLVGTLQNGFGYDYYRA